MISALDRPYKKLGTMINESMSAIDLDAGSDEDDKKEPLVNKNARDGIMLTT